MLADEKNKNIEKEVNYMIELYLCVILVYFLLLFFWNCIICNIIPRSFSVESSPCITLSVGNVSLNSNGIVIVTEFLGIRLPGLRPIFLWFSNYSSSASSENRSVSIYFISSCSKNLTQSAVD